MTFSRIKGYRFYDISVQYFHKERKEKGENYALKSNYRTYKIYGKKKVTNLLISDPYSIKYYTDYYNQPGERFFLLNISSSGQHSLFLNRLFPEPNALDNSINVIWYNDGEDIITLLNNNLSGQLIGIDKFWSSHFLLELMNLNNNLQFINGSKYVDYQRSIKSIEEQNNMRQASYLNDLAMLKMIDYVKFGYTEEKMVQLLDETYRLVGSKGYSFEPIIAYGANAADPHHSTNTDSPNYGDTVIIDMGSFYQDYASDMTRTVFYGKPTEEALKIYNIVKEANEKAIAMIKPGITFSEIDHTARQIIETAGYGEFFTHRLGHFIGQEAHEAGDVSLYNYTKAEIGQVFSIEPGIYIPNKLGVRIEDLVIVTEDGCEVLNKVSKDPIIIEPLNN